MTRANNDGTRVSLIEDFDGGHRTHWAELAPQDLHDRYQAETLAHGCASPAIQAVIDGHKSRASKLAARWSEMSFAQAKAEFDAL